MKISDHPNYGVIQVWDVAVRLGHWLLVLIFAGSWATAKLGWGSMDAHLFFGYAALTWWFFRLGWGWFGGHYARFFNFVRSPRAVWYYLRGQEPNSTRPALGHNPLGGYSVLLMMGLLGVQVLTGLFADDGVLVAGPLADDLPGFLSRLLTRIHKLNAYVLLAVVGLHITAIAYYFFAGRENLVKPMITGYKNVPVDSDLATKTAGDISAQASDPRLVWWALAWLLICALGTTLLAAL